MFRSRKPTQASARMRGMLALSLLFVLLGGMPGDAFATGVGSAAGAANAVSPALASPGHHGLVLLPNGQMAGWGANGFAQVQAGQGDFLPNPQRISLPGTRAMAVAVGGRHSLAIDEAGRVWAWGDNSSGQLGLGHTRPAAGMALVQGLPTTASVIAAGSQHSTALLTDGTVWVWGANNRGQLGRGAADAFAVQAKPARVATPARVADVASGHDFVLALVGPRDRSGSAKGTVWAWGAGNGAPHVVDGLQSATVVRAAGDLAMARTGTGGYWQWNPGQTAPGIAQRAAFEKLGEMTHPALAVLTTPPGLPAAESLPRPAPAKAVATASPPPTAATAPAAAPPRAAPAPTPPQSPPQLQLPPLRVAPVVAAAVPVVAAPAAANSPAPVAAAAAAAAAAAPAPVAVAAPAATPPALLRLSGTVRLSSGFGGDSTGKVLENVQMAADGGQCSATDSQGRYVCSVAAGWTGRVTLRRVNYRFSPSARSFQNLRVDAGQQDFAAIYDPR